MRSGTRMVCNMHLLLCLLVLAAAACRFCAVPCVMLVAGALPLCTCAAGSGKTQVVPLDSAANGGGKLGGHKVPEIDRVVLMLLLLLLLHHPHLHLHLHCFAGGDVQRTALLSACPTSPQSVEAAAAAAARREEAARAAAAAARSVPVTYATKEEAREAFKALLSDMDVPSEATWDQAMRLIVNDARYGALKAIGEKKSAFNEYCTVSATLVRCGEGGDSAAETAHVMRFLSTPGTHWQERKAETQQDLSVPCVPLLFLLPTPTPVLPCSAYDPPAHLIMLHCTTLHLMSRCAAVTPCC